MESFMVTQTALAGVSFIVAAFYPYRSGPAYAMLWLTGFVAVLGVLLAVGVYFDAHVFYPEALNDGPLGVGMFVDLPDAVEWQILRDLALSLSFYLAPVTTFGLGRLARRRIGRLTS
ncbi:MAG: hypothetical protein HYV13_00790 [Candidatus Doudnabacteria bacterium]|nr:hypothetical protein [Candidatus Doudnabacteria bacterium]